MLARCNEHLLALAATAPAAAAAVATPKTYGERRLRARARRGEMFVEAER